MATSSRRFTLLSCYWRSWRKVWKLKK